MEDIEEEFKASNIISPNNDDPSKGGLWIGNIFDANNINSLKLSKINHVLTIIDDQEKIDILKKLYKTNGITHKVIIACDIEVIKLRPFYEEAISFIKSGLENGNIMVHCMGGMSRSVSMVIAYLLKTTGGDYMDLLRQIKQKRFIMVNDGFAKELKAYQEE